MKKADNKNSVDFVPKDKKTALQKTFKFLWGLVKDYPATSIVVIIPVIAIPLTVVFIPEAMAALGVMIGVCLVMALFVFIKEKQHNVYESRRVENYHDRVENHSHLGFQSKHSITATELAKGSNQGVFKDSVVENSRDQHVSSASDVTSDQDDSNDSGIHKGPGF